tara:strand:- start:201 stop:551 length:351 start_codon:yes stop_codon:yes gene_type:complete
MEPPIDFEHKKWILFAYLKSLDEEFYEMSFSPHLLHSEKLLSHMIESYGAIANPKQGMENIEFREEGNRIFWDYVAPEMPEYMDTYISVLKFSIPLLKDKISFGRKLWDSENTLLW